MKKFLKKIRQKFKHLRDQHVLQIAARLITFEHRCQNWLETLPSKKTGNKSFIFFEPFSLTGFFISLAISAASFGAQLLVSKLLQPKQQPRVEGKLTGKLQLTDSIWGADIWQIHGGRGTDGIGGIEVGANIFFLPEIRRYQTTTQTGGGGKGGGGGRSNQTTTITYKCDLAAGFGEGRLRLLRLKFNDDVVYNISGGVTTVEEPDRFEAESGTLTGTAAITEDLDCSNDLKVTGIGPGGTLTVNFGSDSLNPGDPPGPTDEIPYWEFTIFYKSSGDRQAYCRVDGTGGIYNFPDTAGNVGRKTFLREFSSGAHTLEFANPSASAPDIDCVDIGIIWLTAPTSSGIRDESYPSEFAQDNLLLPAVYDFDTNPIERFQGQRAPDEDGVLEFTLPNGANACWYEGTETQPIDAVIAASVDAQYGTGSTPAFLGLSYLRVQNFDVSKYGAIPQIRALVENVETKTVEEICTAAALRSGLTADDFDYSAGANKHIRGMHGNGNDSAETFMEMCAAIHNLSFVETADGKHIIKDLSDTASAATITKRDLGAYTDEEQPPLDDIITKIKDENDLIRTFELQFYNPEEASDFGTDRRSYTYPFTDSKRVETKSLNATLLPSEADSIIRRELQKHHLKSDPTTFVVPYKFCWLDGGDCVEVEVANNDFQKFRIEEKTGSAPGIYEISATPENAVISADTPFAAETGGIRTIPRAVSVPSNTIGTIIDIPALVDAHEQKKGVYVAACPKPGYGIWNGCGVFREKAGEKALMVSLERECSMGVAVNALGEIPLYDEPSGFFDISSELTVDFYNGYEPSSIDSLLAEEGANIYVAGNEVLVVMTWTRNNDYENRWVGTDIYRILKNTENKSAEHIVGERVVLLNDAVKFVSLDESEIGIEREWKFVTSGQLIDDAAPIAFTWAGSNLYNKVKGAPEISQIFDAESDLIRIGVKNFSGEARYRRIEIASNSDMSDGIESVIDADEYNNSFLQDEFLLTDPSAKHSNETFYVRVSHSSNNREWSEYSNILTVTFGSSAGDFDPSPVVEIEIE